jgi:phosphate transport system permease protein
MNEEQTSVPESSFDSAAPLTPTGNLRRRRAISRVAEFGATFAAALAVCVLGIVVYSVLVHGASALSLDFLLEGAPNGIGPALVGTAEIVAMAIVFAVPFGVLVALYLVEFGGGRLAALIRTTLDVMNGYPSIIVGVFIYILIVEAAQSQSGIAASVALAIIMLPIVARGTEEVLRLVPDSMREASDALGVSRWRSVLTVILPSAVGGIATASILAVARAAGETAPLLLISSNNPGLQVSLNPFEAVPNIPVTIYRLSEEANPEGFARAWGAGFVLLAFIMAANVFARVLLNRSRRKMAR